MSAADEQQSPSMDELGMRILEDMQPFRGVVRGLVAQYEADGFTPEQARAIVAMQLTNYRTPGGAA